MILIDSMKHTSRRIVEQMGLKGWTQIDLSVNSGVSQSTVNRTLNSDINTRVGTLIKIAKSLGLPIEYLIVEDETKANLCLEISRMNKEEIHQALLHILRKKNSTKSLKKHHN